MRWRAGAAIGAVEELQIERLCLRPASEADEAEPAEAQRTLPSPPSALSDARVASAVCHFFEWCSLREEALVARRAGEPPPWCSHPLLARHHFCNVSRLDDRGTAAFHAFLRAQRVTSLAGVLWCSLVYRRLNRLTTFADWGGRLPLPREARAWTDWVSARAADPGAPPLFTSKHQQSGGLDSYLATVRGLAGLDTPQQLGFPHARSLAAALAACSNTREAHGTLKAHVRHVGDFIAWQVLCDLVEAGAMPQAARDDWVALGPGAKAGLALIFGERGAPAAAVGVANGEDVATPCADAIERLRALQAAQCWALRTLGRRSYGRLCAEEGAQPLLLRDLEHSLCEFSKWFALRRGWCTPGGYEASASALPMLPEMRVQRLEGDAFRVLPPDDGGAAAEGDDGGSIFCAAFPPVEAASGEEAQPEPPPLPPWLPRESGARKRVRDGPGRAPRGPKKPKGPRPERAALHAWFEAFWPVALAAGWTTVTKTRQGGATAGTCDSYWISPTGKRFRSRAEVAAHEGFVGPAAPAAQVDDQAAAPEAALAAASDDSEESGSVGDAE